MFGLWQHKLFRFKMDETPPTPAAPYKNYCWSTSISKSTWATMGGPPNTIFKLVTLDFLRRHSSRSGCFQVTEFPEPENKHQAQLLIPFVFSFKYKNTQAMQREQSSIVSDFTKPSPGATIASCHLHISPQTHLTFTLKRPRAELTHAPFGPAADRLHSGSL